MTKTGAACSIYQHGKGETPIDYETCTAKGIDFAVIQYRDEAADVNPFFERDISGFRSAGVPVGSYIFLRPDMPAAAQADELKMLAEFGPVWAAIEVSGNFGRSELAPWLHQLLESAPHIGVCSYPSFVREYNLELAPPAWLNDFGLPNPPPGALVWGMTSQAEVPGIDGGVDLLAWCGTSAQFDEVMRVGLAPANGSPAVAARTWPAPPRIIGGASRPTGDGFWLLGEDGSVLAMGDAAWHGSPAAGTLKASPVGLVATPGGRGYRVLTANAGETHLFGDARPRAA
jgi:hypothetical protein